MSLRPKRQKWIIEELGKKNDQTFEDLKRSTKMGREAIYIGLGELKTEGVVKRDEKTKRYNLQSEIKNKILLAGKDFTNFDLDDAMKELQEHKDPFEVGYALLRTATFSLSKMTLEYHSPGLTEFEKHEYEKMIEYYNKVISRTFNVLEEINFDQTMAIKNALVEANTIPQYELRTAFKANRVQKRRAERKAKKLHQSTPDRLWKKIKVSKGQIKNADKISRKVFNKKLY